MAAKEKGKLRIKKRYLIVSAMVAVVCVAVYLNWRYGGEPETPVTDAVADASKTLGESKLVNADGTVNTEALDALAEDAESAAEAAGSGGDYFAQARLTRQKARDEAREVLSGMMSDPDCDDDARRQASQEVGVLAACITMEADIETLVKAKGFTECVAVVTNGGASLIVQTDGLEKNEVAQLQEILLDETGMTPDKVKIMEIK